MIRIAIVDDIDWERLELKERIQTTLKHLDWENTIFEYYDGRTFLSAARNKPFDLAFLDIYMNGINGVDTARKLRTFDTDCTLVFTTNSTEHALEGYRVRAMQYLVKPYSAREIDLIFNELKSRLPAMKKYIEIKSGRQNLKLQIDHITHANHFQHQVYIHLTHGREITSRINFKEFCHLLDDERFFVCSRGSVINLSYVSDFDGMDFQLQNGTVIPVSRALIQTARQAFGEHLFQKGQNR